MDPLWALGLGGAAALWLSHIIWPFKTCAACSGTGQLTSPTGKAWRVCDRCRGAKHTVRLGRRIYDALRHPSR